MSTDVARWIYGTRDAHAILETPAEQRWMIPPSVGDLQLLGTYYELFTWINRSGMTQAEIAARFGVSQQAVSRYITATSQPLFSAREWQRLVTLYLDVGEPEARISAGLAR